MAEPITLKSHTVVGTRTSPARSPRISSVGSADGASKAGPKLLITGGVHGDEFEPMVAIRRLIAQLKPGDIFGTLTLVPVVNEPAFARGRRTADDELDLARTCPGDPNGSITQRIAHAVSQLIRAADFYIDLHTGGTVIPVFPLVGYTLHPDTRVLEAQRTMARAFNLPIVWGTDPNLPGRTLSVARQASVPAIYAEYLGGGGCDPRGVEAYVEGCLNVMAVLGMIDRDLPTSRIEHAVEDDRPSSGHLQRCNPAPCDGYFEPSVKLGDVVRVGQTLGHVVDAIGRSPVEITAQTAGKVIVLRLFPSVKAGDSLAVILELRE